MKDIHTANKKIWTLKKTKTHFFKTFHFFRILADSVEPDQDAASDQGLHYLHTGTSI